MPSTETTSPSPLPATQTLIVRVASVFMRLAQLVTDRLVRDRSRENLARVLTATDRLMLLSRRLRDLIERIAAGKVVEPRPRKLAVTGVERAKPVARERLTRRRGWLREHAGPDYHLVNWGIGQVEQLLADPAALGTLEKAPRQAGRLVRSICFMMNIEVPTAFRPPPRPKREPKPRAPKPAPWTMPWGTPRVASAKWPKGCVAKGETVPLRKRNRGRQRRNE